MSGLSYANQKIIDTFVRKYMRHKNPTHIDLVPEFEQPHVYNAIELIVRRVERKQSLSCAEYLDLVVKAARKYSGVPGAVVRRMGERRRLSSEAVDAAVEAANLDLDLLDRSKLRYPWWASEDDARKAAREEKAAARKVQRAKERIDDLDKRRLCAAFFKRIGRDGATHDEIVAQAHPLVPICGVYFLVKDGRVVYVGQSVNIVARLGTHLKQKDFDSSCYIAAGPHELDFIESFYIHLLRPELNGPPR